MSPAFAEPAPLTDLPAACRYTDVHPEVLARELASEAKRQQTAASPSWLAYLRRVLPAMELRDPDDMAAALLATDLRAAAARRHAQEMAQRAAAAGDSWQERFWHRVTDALDRHAPREESAD